MNLPLELPLFLLLIPLGLIVVFRLVRQKSSLGFSSATLLKNVGISFSLTHLEKLFLSGFVITGSLILARPTRLEKTFVPVYTQARDISLVLDTSGSMTHDKLKAAVDVITGFVAGRQQDRIALFVFSSEASLDWPLSFDHETLLYRLKSVTANGGTRIAAGLIAALEHHRSYGQNPGAIILVSDGGSEISPEEKKAITDTLGQTKLYWIWISEVDAPEDQEALNFGVYVTELDGKIYRGGPSDLPEIFRQIDKLETSPVLYEEHVSTTYQFGVLPALALVSLLLAGLVHIIREI